MKWIKVKIPDTTKRYFNHPFVFSFSFTIPMAPSRLLVDNFRLSDISDFLGQS